MMLIKIRMFSKDINLNVFLAISTRPFIAPPEDPESGYCPQGLRRRAGSGERGGIGFISWLIILTFNYG